MIDRVMEELTTPYLKRVDAWNRMVEEWLEECKAEDDDE